MAPRIHWSCAIEGATRRGGEGAPAKYRRRAHEIAVACLAGVTQACRHCPYPMAGAVHPPARDRDTHRSVARLPASCDAIGRRCACVYRFGDLNRCATATSAGEGDYDMTREDTAPDHNGSSIDRKSVVEGKE